MRVQSAAANVRTRCVAVGARGAGRGPGAGRAAAGGMGRGTAATSACPARPSDRTTAERRATERGDRAEPRAGERGAALAPGAHGRKILTYRALFYIPLTCKTCGHLRHTGARLARARHPGALGEGGAARRAPANGPRAASDQSDSL